MKSVTPTVFIPSYSFKRYDCSHFEHVHPIFCAHFIIFLGVLNLDITSTPPLECLHCLFVLSVIQTDFTPLYSNFT